MTAIYICSCPNGFLLSQYPIHWAVFSGCLATVNMLLDLGADPNVEDNSNRRPIDIAILKGLDDIRDRLLEKGSPGELIERVLPLKAA